jgi:hypothetical protein
VNLLLIGLMAATLDVRLVNPEVVPPGMRSRATKLATEILRAAGVDPAWTECPCPEQPGARTLWLQLLPEKPPNTSGDSLGFAVVYPTADGRRGYAAIFYRQVLDTAASENGDPAVLLGAALVHEIGHLLLGPGHSPRGVMKPRFRRTDLQQAARGELRFTPEQSRQIRRILYPR